jgi:hypothetical protein
MDQSWREREELMKNQLIKRWWSTPFMPCVGEESAPWRGGGFAESFSF